MNFEKLSVNDILREGAEIPPVPEDFLFGIKLPPPLSVNEVLYLSPIDRSRLMKAEREKGYIHALEIARFGKRPIITKRVYVPRKGEIFRDVWRDFLTDKKIFTFVRIWREPSKKDPLKSNRQRDIYNVMLKSYIDGFTDAGVWEDDSEQYHTDFYVNYAGLAPQAKTEVYFYAKN